MSNDFDEKQKQEAMSKWSQVPFSNRFMFRLVMENHEICKRTLELLLGMEIAELNYVEGEKSFEAKLSSKGIRLDVFIKDKSGNVFDLEMQANNDDHDALGKRTRYYQSVVDADSLKKGVAYALLPKSIILFICMYDPYGKDFVRYTFSNFCHEDKDLELGDFSSKVIINSIGNKGGFSHEVCNFLDYVNTGEAKDEFTKKIDAEVVLQRSDEDKAVWYMTWDQEQMAAEARGEAKGRAEGEAKGRAEGRTEGKAEEKIETAKKMKADGMPISNIVKYTDLTAEQIAKL